MLIHDWRRLLDAIELGWTLADDDECEMLIEHLGREDFDQLNYALENRHT